MDKHVSSFFPNPAFALVFFACWALILPAIFLMSYLLMHDGWILQQTPLQWIAIVVGAFAWGSPTLLVLAKFQPSELAGIFGWFALAGMVGGSLALDLANSVGDSSPGEVVRVTMVKAEGRRTKFRVIEDRYAHLTFACSNSTWHRAREDQFTVHRGRLGLYWGEFP